MTASDGPEPEAAPAQAASPAAIFLAELDAAATIARTTADGSTLVWRSWGAGPPLLLLHGGSGSWRHWARNIPGLAIDRRVLAVDLPGMGDSDLPTGPIDRARIARMIMAGLPELIGEAGCDLVGFSFGGAVAGLAAGIAPARIRSLTLVGSAGFGAPYNNPVLVKLRGLRGADRGAAHRINLERLMFADPARIDDLALEIQEQNTRRARLPSLNDRDLVMLPGGLGAFSGPCHAIWGEQDSFVSGHLDSRIERLRAARPGVDIELVPGVGHWVAYEAAERFGDYLRTRLQDLPGAASG